MFWRIGRQRLRNHAAIRQSDGPDGVAIVLGDSEAIQNLRHEDIGRSVPETMDRRSALEYLKFAENRLDWLAIDGQHSSAQERQALVLCLHHIKAVGGFGNPY